MEQDNAQQLAAELDGHQITDDDGQVRQEGDATLRGEPAAPEPETTVEEPARSEKTAAPETPAPRPMDLEDENELAEDDAGKRYVPESRFKDVYGKMKALERELKSKPQQQAPVVPAPPPLTPGSTPTRPDKADQLEVELLYGTLPQFNPSSEDYSEELDRMGYEIYVANPGITRLEAGRRALDRVKKLGVQEASVKAVARSVKAQQSDQGITSRVLNREGQAPDPDKMSLDEKEKWLRDNGYW